MGLNTCSHVSAYRVLLDENPTRDVDPAWWGVHLALLPPNATGPLAPSLGPGGALLVQAGLVALRLRISHLAADEVACVYVDHALVAAFRGEGSGTLPVERQDPPLGCTQGCCFRGSGAGDGRGWGGQAAVRGGVALLRLTREGMREGAANVMGAGLGPTRAHSPSVLPSLPPLLPSSSPFLSLSGVAEAEVEIGGAGGGGEEGAAWAVAVGACVGEGRCGPTPMADCLPFATTLELQGARDP